jgi:hypothetical protein
VFGRIARDSYRGRPYVREIRTFWVCVVVASIAVENPCARVKATNGLQPRFEFRATVWENRSMVLQMVPNIFFSRKRSRKLQSI